jgi:putative Mn2+ efflux pump MntP
MVNIKNIYENIKFWIAISFMIMGTILIIIGVYNVITNQKNQYDYTRWAVGLCLIFLGYHYSGKVIKNKT